MFHIITNENGKWEMENGKLLRSSRTFVLLTPFFGDRAAMQTSPRLFKFSIINYQLSTSNTIALSRAEKAGA